VLLFGCIGVVKVVVDSTVYCGIVGSAAAGTDASLSHLAMAEDSSWLSE
jgi:hypothetical protein